MKSKVLVFFFSFSPFFSGAPRDTFSGDGDRGRMFEATFSCATVFPVFFWVSSWSFSLFERPEGGGFSDPQLSFLGEDSFLRASSFHQVRGYLGFPLPSFTDSAIPAFRFFKKLLTFRKIIHHSAPWHLLIRPPFQAVSSLAGALFPSSGPAARCQTSWRTFLRCSRFSSSDRLTLFPVFFLASR